MKITYVGEFMGFPEEEFDLRLPAMKGVKRIKLFGTHGNEIVISKGWKERIMQNVINARIIEMEEREEETLILGLPFNFRTKYIDGDKKRLAQALRCLFRKK